MDSRRKRNDINKTKRFYSKYVFSIVFVIQSVLCCVFYSSFRLFQIAFDKIAACLYVCFLASLHPYRSHSTRLFFRFSTLQSDFRFSHRNRKFFFALVFHFIRTASSTPHIWSYIHFCYQTFF